MIILYGKTVWCFCMVIFHNTDACPSPLRILGGLKRDRGREGGGGWRLEDKN